MDIKEGTDMCKYLRKLSLRAPGEWDPILKCSYQARQDDLQKVERILEVKDHSFL